MKNLSLYLIAPFLILGGQNIAAMGDEKSENTGLDRIELSFMAERLGCCYLKHAKHLSEATKTEFKRACRCGFDDIESVWSSDCKDYTDCKGRHTDIITCAERARKNTPVFTTSQARHEYEDAEMGRCVEDLTKQRKARSRIQSMLDSRISPYTKCVARLNEKFFAIATKQPSYALTASEGEKFEVEFEKCSTKLTADKR